MHVLSFYRMKIGTSMIQNGVFPLILFTKRIPPHQPQLAERDAHLLSLFHFFRRKRTCLNHSFPFSLHSQEKKLSKSVICLGHHWKTASGYIFWRWIFSKSKTLILSLLWNLPMLSGIKTMLKHWATSPGGMEPQTQVSEWNLDLSDFCGIPRTVKLSTISLVGYVPTVGILQHIKAVIMIIPWIYHLHCPEGPSQNWGLSQIYFFIDSQKI